MVSSNEDPIKQAGFFKRIKRIRSLLNLLFPSNGAKTSLSQKASLPSARPAISKKVDPRSIFWKGSISGEFRKDAQELIIYFYVSRSASRAQTLKQEISAQGGSAEILRLVSWDYSNTSIFLEVRALGHERWECVQIKTEGIREPFGYIVLSSCYVKGLVNSFIIVRRELYQHPMRFQVDENSNCIRLPNSDTYLLPPS
ncbi:MAG: hypothetical protein WCA07_10485 [Gloeobacterales cyanobacterium]